MHTMKSLFYEQYDVLSAYQNEKRSSCIIMLSFSNHTLSLLMFQGSSVIDAVLVPSPPIQLHLPLTTPLPGSELTKEPFRWDQRLFSLVLRISGNASVEPEPLGGVPSDDSPITPMCEVTGGRWIAKLGLCEIWVS